MYESIKTAVTTRQAAETFGLTVNRSGMAACPFHDDHIPSLKLDQRYYCFGCGATGDVIDFMVPNLMRKATQFVGARKSIGKGAGENASQKEKISDGMLVLGALTSWALEGSVVTGDSMRARGYGTARRSSFMIYRMTGQDWELLASMLFLLILVSVFHNNACALRSANRYDAVSPPDKKSCN